MFYKQLNTTERTNFNHFVIDVVWYGLGFAATSRFLSVFAIRLGATPTELGWISSLPALFLLITSTLGSWWRNRYHTTLKALMPVAFIVRLPFLLPAFAPLFPEKWRPLWIILSVSLPALAQGLASVTFVVFMREASTDRMITPLLSLRSLALNVGVGIAALVYGVWLETAPFPFNYQSMFVLAFFFTLMSQWHVSRCKVLTEPSVKSQKAESPLVAWKSRTFQPVIFAAAIIHVAFTILVQIVALYLIRHHGASEGFIAIFSMVELSSAALIGLVTPQIVKAIGNRTMIGGAMVGTGIGVLIIALAPNINLTLIGAVITGASWTTAVSVGLFGFYMEAAPRENTAPYSAAYHQAIGLGAFIGPLIGGWLADGGFSLVAVMVIGALARILAGILIEAPMARRHSHEIAAKLAH